MTKKEIIEKYGEEEYQRKLEYQNQYNQQHKEEKKQYNKQHYQQHKEEMKEQKKQYYQQHREEAKRYNQQHKEEKRQYNKQHYQQHKEEMKEQKKQYYQQHREEKRQYNKQYQRKHNQMFAYCIPEEIEQVENYELAKKNNFNGWHIHHRLETHNADGEKRLVNLSRAELIALDMYFNRPANELVFLTNSEHAKLHRMKSVALFS